MTRRLKHLVHQTSALIVLVASSAEAQDVAEVVVTANRRSQLLEDVGASIDSIDGSSLQARGVVSTSDLQKLVPGFTAADTGVNIPVYSLRGVGLNEPSLAANSTIAISVDEVPLPYAVMSQGEILDVQRVEVLKGPQGTLYGLNSTGGAINYIANKPGDSLAAGWDVGVGRFDTVSGDFFLSGPLGNTFKARLAVGGTRGSPWQENFTRADELGRVARSSARLLLNWQPIAKLDVDLNLNGWLDRSDTQASQIVTFRPQVAANVPRVPDVFSSPITPADSRAANWNPARDYSRNDDFQQFSLQARYELGEHAQLTSITAWSDFDSRAFNDRDGMAPADFEFGTTGHIESLYQEVRLSHETDALAWSLGGNFRKDRTFDFQATDVSRGTNTFVAGLKLNTVDIYSDQHVETHAVFADGELRLSPRWSLVAGVRYTWDKRNFSGSTCDDGDGETSAVYTALSNTFRTRFGLPELAPIAPGECVTLSPDTFTPGVVSDSLDEDNIAFRGQVNVKPTDHSLLYASFSRGFKAGSFPTVATVFSPGYDPAKQERVDALELGFNATLFERRARLQGAAFHYDYDDKQLRGRILDPVIGNLAKLVNVPRAEMGGFELDLAISPVPGLTLQTAVAYLHTEVKEFTGVNLFGQTEDFAGQTLPYSSPWSVNAGGQYEWRVFDGNKAFAGADYAYRSRTSGFIGRDRPVDIRAWATLDLRAGIRFRDDRWKIEIWGHNVTDTDYVTSAMRNGDTVNAYSARPATYGLSVGFRH